MGKPRKRISGAGSVPTGGFTRYQRAMGIDVDSKFLVVAFADRTAPEINTVEFPNDAYGIRRLVEAANRFTPSLVVCESTANFHIAAYDALLAAGISAIVINPLHVKSLLRVEGKSDKADAATLARLALSFRLKASNVPDSRQRELRTYISA